MYGTFTSSRTKPYRETTINYSGDGYPLPAIVVTGLRDDYVSTMTRTGSVTANYRVLLKQKKQIPPLNYTYYRKITNGLRGSSSSIGYYSAGRVASHVTRQGAFTGYYGSSFDFTTYQASAAELSALSARHTTKTLLKIKDQKVNIAQAFAERAQTTTMLGDSAIKIAKALSALKRGNLVEAAANLGTSRPSQRAVKKFNRNMRKKSAENNVDSAISSGWLQLQYGWAPLLSDCYGSAELIAQKQVREVLTRVSSKDLLVLANDDTFQYSNWTVNRVRSVEITMSTTIYFSPSGSGAAHTLAQIGLTNPLLIAWELLPWSFVIDWFIPVGNYVSSLDATLGCAFVSGTTTTIKKHHANATWSRNNRWVSGYLENGFLSGSEEIVDVKRVVLTNFPSAHFPSFKNPVSTTHLANALALLNQLRKKT